MFDVSHGNNKEDSERDCLKGLIEASNISSKF